MRTFALVVVTSAAYDGLCVGGPQLDAVRFDLTRYDQDINDVRAKEVTQEEACQKELNGTWNHWGKRTLGWFSSWFNKDEDECDCHCCVPKVHKAEAEEKLQQDLLDNEVKFNDLTRHAAMALDDTLAEKLKEFFPNKLGSDEAQRMICVSLHGAFDSNWHKDYCQVSSDVMKKLNEKKSKLSKDALECAYDDDDIEYKEKGFQFSLQREACEGPNNAKTGYQFFESLYLINKHCGCSCCKEKKDVVLEDD